MSYLDEIAAIIEHGTTEAGVGSNFPIFRSHLPDSTVLGDRAVGLLHTEGFGDQGRVDITSPGLQVVTRGRSVMQTSTAYEEAADVAEAVKNAIHQFVGKIELDAIGGGFTGLSTEYALRYDTRKRYVGIWSQNGPFFAGFDESMRPIFSNNFRVQRSRTT